MVRTVQSHRITPWLSHVDIHIFYLQNEHGNGFVETNSVLSRIQFSNVGTKTESGQHLMRSSFISMNHVHVHNLPTDQYDVLVSIAPISCYNQFRRV